MKILLYTDSLGAGGAQRQLVGLANMLSKRSFDVVVYTYYDFDFYKQYLDENGIRNICMSDAVSPCSRIIETYKYFKKEKPDWVIAYQETPSMVACFIKALGCRYKLLVSERNTTQRINRNDLIRFWSYRFADSIVPNCFTQERFLTSNYTWMSKKICTITNFVDLDYFAPKERSINSSRKVVVVASIWPPKNTLGFINACILLNQRGVDYRVDWYGISDLDTEYLEKCEDLIKENNVKNIKLLPKTKNIKDVYLQSDIVCLPSFYEGTPNVICEAISCGKPILCSNVCDNSLYVKNSFNGFLFDPKEPTDIADKMQQMIELDNKCYHLFSKNSRKVAEEKLSSSLFLDKYIKIILNHE